MCNLPIVQVEVIEIVDLTPCEISHEMHVKKEACMVSLKKELPWEHQNRWWLVCFVHHIIGYFSFSSLSFGLLYVRPIAFYLAKCVSFLMVVVEL